MRKGTLTLVSFDSPLWGRSTCFTKENRALLHPKMTKKAASLSLGVLVCGVCLWFATPLCAQEEDPSLVVELINRVETLETDQRELRGQIDEARHELSVLKQRTDTLSTDVDFRLSGGGGAPSLSRAAALSSDEDVLSSLPTLTAEEEYEKARSLLEQGDYEAAEKAFSALVSTHPKDKVAGSAQYWLGVTYFVRGQHEKAVTAFAKGYKNYPKSPKAPDSLLKLAKSLGQLDRKADACTTLGQLLTEYPKSSLVKEASAEKTKLGCK